MKDIEREAIILNSAWKMIDDIVNWGMFMKTEQIELTNLMFKNSSQSRLFIILLGDFLSEIRAFKGEQVPLGLKSVPSKVSSSNLTFLFHLRQVCINPQFGTDSSSITTSVESFAKWLEAEFKAPSVNLANIDLQVDLKITRYRYLKMCGDIAKHNLARLETNVKHLRKLLHAAGQPVSIQKTYLAVEDFFDWFFECIFSHHFSQIAEFLNNIRWSIYRYLQAEFNRSYRLTDMATEDFHHYSYLVPEDIKDPVAIAMYWDLMNRTRSKPYMQEFILTGSEYF